MTFRALLLSLACTVLLTACGGAPEYSGRQESTEGVPGFAGGKKQSRYVKLGQSYKINGEWYVPRFEPDYNEVGLASWYGPGFHGGKTANGEAFDKHSMTAAHKTLPLPSIVRVTMVETGKQIFVRINDRGPFAENRIIDLSYAAAKEIGLIRKGVAKVRVEYMLPESQRFADLLAQGRAPESIDIAREILPYAHKRVAVAAAEIDAKAQRPVTDRSWWDEVKPVSSAHAAPAPRYAPSVPSAAAPTHAVMAQDLPPATLPPVSPAQVSMQGYSNNPNKLAPLPAEPHAVEPAPPARALDPPSAPAAVAPAPGTYVQIGTFSVEQNALSLASRVATIGPANISPVARGDATLYRVRLGPYSTVDMAEEVLQRVHRMGMVDARFVHP